MASPLGLPAGDVGQSPLTYTSDVMMNSTDPQNYRNALIELRHILLEIENSRAQHFRHFIDQYYCYKNGHVKGTGTADWESIVWKGHVSLEAGKLADRKLVVKEHAVPLLVLREMLMELSGYGEVTIDGIASVLDKNVTFATITKGEDKILRTRGLNSKMPAGFRTLGHKLYGDVLARYKYAGIEMEWRPTNNVRSRELTT